MNYSTRLVSINLPDFTSFFCPIPSIKWPAPRKSTPFGRIGESKGHGDEMKSDWSPMSSWVEHVLGDWQARR